MLYSRGHMALVSRYYHLHKYEASVPGFKYHIDPSNNPFWFPLQQQKINRYAPTNVYVCKRATLVHSWSAMALNFFFFFFPTTGRVGSGKRDGSVRFFTQTFFALVLLALWCMRNICLPSQLYKTTNPSTASTDTDDFDFIFALFSSLSHGWLCHSLFAS